MQTSLDFEWKWRPGDISEQVEHVSVSNETMIAWNFRILAWLECCWNSGSCGFTDCCSMYFVLQHSNLNSLSSRVSTANLSHWLVLIPSAVTLFLSPQEFQLLVYLSSAVTQLPVYLSFAVTSFLSPRGSQLPTFCAGWCSLLGFSCQLSLIRFNLVSLSSGIQLPFFHVHGYCSAVR